MHERLHQSTSFLSQASSQVFSCSHFYQVLVVTALMLFRLHRTQSTNSEKLGQIEVAETMVRQWKYSLCKEKKIITNLTMSEELDSSFNLTELTEIVNNPAMLEEFDKLVRHAVRRRLMSDEQQSVQLSCSIRGSRGLGRCRTAPWQSTKRGGPQEM